MDFLGTSVVSVAARRKGACFIASFFPRDLTNLHNNIPWYWPSWSSWSYSVANSWLDSLTSLELCQWFPAFFMKPVSTKPVSTMASFQAVYFSCNICSPLTLRRIAATVSDKNTELRCDDVCVGKSDDFITALWVPQFASCLYLMIPQHAFWHLNFSPDWPLWILVMSYQVDLKKMCFILVPFTSRKTTELICDISWPSLGKVSHFIKGIAKKISW